MSIVETKAVVSRFFEALRQGDVGRLADLIADDATWWVAPTYRFSGTYDKPQMVAILTHLFAASAGPYDARIVELTAEDDRVSATAVARLELKDGTLYQNDYHALFRVTNGRITACKEFFDSYRAGLAFGFPD